MKCKVSFNNKKQIDNEDFWREYVEGKQTYQQLATKYNCSVKTIIRKLDGFKSEYKSYHLIQREGVLLVDTTYYGRNFGIMVFKDSESKKILLIKKVKNETKLQYISGIEILIKHGYQLKGLVCDGKKYLFTAFKNLPVQMCQFHQSKIIKNYLTNNPKLAASQELLALAESLSSSSKNAFEQNLREWFQKWENFYNERSISANKHGKKRSFYTHKRLRSAYKSLITNLPVLFTYEQYPNLNMPNTNNSLEGQFSGLKKMTNLHNGLNSKRKLNFILYYLNPLVYEEISNHFVH